MCECIEEPRDERNMNLEVFDSSTSIFLVLTLDERNNEIITGSRSDKTVTMSLLSFQTDE